MLQTREKTSTSAHKSIRQRRCQPSGHRSGAACAICPLALSAQGVYVSHDLSLHMGLYSSTSLQSTTVLHVVEDCKTPKCIHTRILHTLISIERLLQEYFGVQGSRIVPTCACACLMLATYRHDILPVRGHVQAGKIQIKHTQQERGSPSCDTRWDFHSLVSQLRPRS